MILFIVVPDPPMSCGYCPEYVGAIGLAKPAQNRMIPFWRSKYTGDSNRDMVPPATPNRSRMGLSDFGGADTHWLRTYPAQNGVIRF